MRRTPGLALPVVPPPVAAVASGAAVAASAAVAAGAAVAAVPAAVAAGAAVAAVPAAVAAGAAGAVVGDAAGVAPPQAARIGITSANSSAKAKLLRKFRRFM